MYKYYKSDYYYRIFHDARKLCKKLHVRDKQAHLNRVEGSVLQDSNNFFKHVNTKTVSREYRSVMHLGDEVANNGLDIVY